MKAVIVLVWLLALLVVAWRLTGDTQGRFTLAPSGGGAWRVPAGQIRVRQRAEGHQGRIEDAPIVLEVQVSSGALTRAEFPR